MVGSKVGESQPNNTDVIQDFLVSISHLQDIGSDKNYSYKLSGLNIIIFNYFNPYIHTDQIVYSLLFGMHQMTYRATWTEPERPPILSA